MGTHCNQQPVGVIDSMEKALREQRKIFVRVQRILTESVLGFSNLCSSFE